MSTQHRTPFTDVHAHFLVPEYVAAAREAGIERPDGMPGWPEWTPERSLALMNEVGIGKAYLSISSPGVHFGDDAAARELARLVNERGAELARAHPERFGHFASLPLPDVAGSLAEAEYALDELGADGVAVETNGLGTYLGDDVLAPLWEELNLREAVVFVHPTSPHCDPELFLERPRPMFEFLVDTARTVSDLVLSGTLLRFPKIRWVFTHGGGILPLLADRFEMFRSVFFGETEGESVAEQLGRLWFDMAGTPFPRQMPALTGLVGTDRILYGSDSCWTPDAGVRAQVASIDAAGPVPGTEGTTWRELTAANARRLLALRAESTGPEDDAARNSGADDA